MDEILRNYRKPIDFIPILCYNTYYGGLEKDTHWHEKGVTKCNTNLLTTKELLT